MPQTLTIRLAGPVAAVRVIDAQDLSRRVQQRECETRNKTSETENQKQLQELGRLCALAGDIADKLRRLHEEAVASHRSDLARLAVEISRKILARRVGSGDYDIQAVIEEALKHTPTHQNILVRVNPQDLPQCQKLQQAGGGGPFAALEFVADRTIARADCVVETPKGIVKSFVEQHLERIVEALARAG